MGSMDYRYNSGQRSHCQDIREHRRSGIFILLSALHVSMWDSTLADTAGVCVSSASRKRFLKGQGLSIQRYLPVSIHFEKFLPFSVLSKPCDFKLYTSQAAVQFRKEQLHSEQPGRASEELPNSCLPRQYFNSGARKDHLGPSQNNVRDCLDDRVPPKPHCAAVPEQR